jgi:hypothetical protein
VATVGVTEGTVGWPGGSPPLEPGVFCVGVDMLQGLASRFKGPWSTDYEHAYRRLRELPLHRLPADAGSLWFARLCAYLRRLEPTGRAGSTILVWRLSVLDMEQALNAAPAELVRASSLSVAMQRHQQGQVSELLAGVRASFEMLE